MTFFSFLQSVNPYIVKLSIIDDEATLNVSMMLWILCDRMLGIKWEMKSELKRVRKDGLASISQLNNIAVHMHATYCANFY